MRHKACRVKKLHMQKNSYSDRVTLVYTHVHTLNLMQTHVFRHSDWLVCKREMQIIHHQRQASWHIPVQHSDKSSSWLAINKIFYMLVRAWHPHNAGPSAVHD